MTRRTFDPSGFDCIHCRLRFPWVASYNEQGRVHVCRNCHKKSNGVRRARSRNRSPLKSIASNTDVGGWSARGFGRRVPQ